MVVATILMGNVYVIMDISVNHVIDNNAQKIVDLMAIAINLLENVHALKVFMDLIAPKELVPIADLMDNATPSLENVSVVVDIQDLIVA